MSTYSWEFLEGNRYKNFQKCSNNDIDWFSRTLSLTAQDKKTEVESREFLLMESREFLLVDAFELLPQVFMTPSCESHSSREHSGISDSYFCTDRLENQWPLVLQQSPHSWNEHLDRCVLRVFPRQPKGSRENWLNKETCQVGSS